MLRVNVLGGLAVDRDGARLEGAAAQPRRLALLALLTVAGPRGLGRDKILSLLWPDADEERGRKNLAQSVYALRQVMGEETVVVGTWELRLNDAAVGSDLAEFETARHSGALDQAAAAYSGPFLDGFHLTGASEFEHWVDEQRSALNHEYADLLERLAAQSREAGDPRSSAQWLRRRAALDPHDARVGATLMRALIAAGDSSGALQVGRSLQAALADELGLPPDREIESLTAGLLSGQVAQSSRPIPAPAVTAPAPAPRQPPTATGPTPAVPPAPAPVVRRTRRLGLAAAGGLVAVAALALVFRGRLFGREAPTLAIGRLADYRAEPREELRGPIMDLLATSLARAPSVRVVSTARMYELMGEQSADPALPISTWAETARKAGASQLIDGALYQLPDGKLRLDLRRLDLVNGRVLGSARAQAADAFSLADSAMAVLLAGMGAEPPRGSIASLTTSSIAAYRLYEQGLRAMYRRDYSTSLALFNSALREDSTFAMAALFAAKTTRNWNERLILIQRAHRMAERATERERLLIRAQAAIQLSDPALAVYVDSLVTRYPGEVDGYLFAGISRVGSGEYQKALPYLERVVELDSVSVPSPSEDCRICEALLTLVGAYHSMDSLDQAEAAARRMVRLAPNWPVGWERYCEILSVQGRYDEAEAAAVQFERLSPGGNYSVRVRAYNLIRAGRGVEAADLMGKEAALSAGERRMESLWYQVVALRDAGRGAEAVAVARVHRAEFLPVLANLGASSSPMLQAMALETAGQWRAAAALFDSIAMQPFPGDNRSHAARTWTWTKALAASALAGGGDTTRLAALADSIRTVGSGSGFVRDRRLHHHVRGLLYAARGQDSLALAEFGQAIVALPTGYTRTNVEAARIHLKRGEPERAIALLEPALRGSLEASNLYVSRSTIHELLAQAWDRQGNPEKAARHRRMASGQALR